MLHYRNCQNRVPGYATLQKLPEQGAWGCYTAETARTDYLGMLHYRNCQNRVPGYATLQKLPEHGTWGCYTAEAARIGHFGMLHFGSCITGYFGMLHCRKYRLVIKDELGVTCSKLGRVEKCVYNFVCKITTKAGVFCRIIWMHL
jgi:hypothetical protein